MNNQGNIQPEYYSAYTLFGGFQLNYIPDKKTPVAE